MIAQPGLMHNIYIRDGANARLRTSSAPLQVSQCRVQVTTVGSRRSLFRQHVSDYFIGRVHDDQLVIDHCEVIRAQRRNIGRRLAWYRLDLHSVRQESANLASKPAAF